MNDNISIQERTEKFAIRVVKAYSEIQKQNNFNDAVVILAKQFLRSGTSVGANCAEAKYAQSRKDFLSKYLIALKEANETKFWIKLIIEAGDFSPGKFSLLEKELDEILGILIATTKKLKDD
ncbi:TIGR02436 family protein [Xenococcus sp. PCC 7305]|uniref:four helix bundle protein n=1 Tax=Xenococcus sp. PCC 7305 TaxID=102125 RepID=UPI0002ABCC5C|nr:four helix bundle protein [Xenococcus sp. PCC 7305]ELS01206.1 TIGR02436 family protein [Xenococcus sp. PCC 7305]